MSKIYQVKNGKQTIEIKANGLCDLEEKVMTLPKISKKKINYCKEGNFFWVKYKDNPNDNYEHKTMKELKDEIITKENALKIIKNHGNSNFSELKDFIKECGNKANYKAIKVFYWLGY